MKNLKKTHHRAISDRNVKPSSNSIWIYGKHPVLSLIKNGKRSLHKVVVTRNALAELENFLSENKIKLPNSVDVEVTDNNIISSLLPEGSVHQGFAIKTSKVKTISLDEFFVKNNITYAKNNSNSPKGQLPFILIMDQLTDPRNIGAIIRTAVAFGVKSIMITKYNSPEETAVVYKASAGTIDLVDMIVVSNLNQAMEDLKSAGYWCIGLDGYAKQSIKTIADYENIALIVGSEGSGMRELVKKNCDLLVNIPIKEEVESLNASVAVSIAMYELITK